MWNRVSLLRKARVLYQSSLQQAPKPAHTKHAKLAHRFLEYFQSNNAKRSGNDQDSLLISASTKGTRSLLQLDKTLCTKASELTNGEILSYLCFYMQKSPAKVTEYEFYSVSKSILAHRIEELTAQEFVQYMYVIALMKKSYEATKYMKKCLSHINSNVDIIKCFSTTDLLVLCCATFKTSTRIPNKELLNRLRECLLNNLNLLEDPGMLTTLVKTLRHNECQDEELLATITAVIFFNKTYRHYSFTSICHILPLYADYSYYDEKLFHLLAECSIEKVKSAQVYERSFYVADNLRTKDIKRFLWCCYAVGHHIDYADLRLFEDRVYEQLLKGCYDEDPESLVDLVYLLWTFEVRSTKLLRACKDKVEILRNMQTKSKIRLNMLLISMQIEDMRLYKQFGHKAEVFRGESRKELEVRPHLTKVYDALKAFMADLDVNRLEIEYQVPHFNILGITGYRRNVYKAFVVEVLDESNRLKNVDGRGNGKMQHMMRLLYKMDLTVVLLNSADFENLNDLDFKDYIRKELSIVT